MSDKPANKIVSSNRLSLKPSTTMFKAILDGVPKSERDEARKRLIRKSKRARMEKGFWKTPKGKISKSARNSQKLKMRQLLKMAKESSVFKEITGKLKPISLEQQFKKFQSLDDAINYQTRFDPRSKSEYKRWSKAYYDNMYKFNKDGRRERQLQIKERNRLRYEINKKLKAGVKAPSIPKSSLLKISNLSRLGSGVSQLGAGIALNALTDKFVKPHTDALGRRAGKKLRKFVDRLEEKNAKKKEK